LAKKLEEVTLLEQEDRDPQQKPVALNEHFAEATTKQALRILILQRFTGWLDDVLAEEKPLEGVAAELLAELYDGKDSNSVDPRAGAPDLHSTWSAMTALTQEIKLQGRAFKQLSEQMAPFVGLDATIDKLLAKHREALHDARRIAEEGRADRTQRESELKLAARDRARREFISVIIEIRESLINGMRSAAESQRKLKEDSNWSRLKNFLINKSADQNHKFEIVNSLKKGYQMGLDRIDESLQQLGVTEIICEGKPFDPRIMNAVDIEETGEAPDGTVLEVFRTGYMIDAEVLQPAQVKVARTPE
jgi:molecular chaperone GrpE